MGGIFKWLKRWGVLTPFGFARIAGIFLLLNAAEDQNDGFYILLRWLVCPLFAVIAWRSFWRERVPLTWAGVIAAGLFNPIVKSDFGYNLWQTIDYVAAGIVLWSFFSLRPEITAEERVEIKKENDAVMAMLDSAQWHRIYPAGQHPIPQEARIQALKLDVLRRISKSAVATVLPASDRARLERLAELTDQERQGLFVDVAHHADEVSLRKLEASARVENTGLYGDIPLHVLLG